jgi:acyl-coenzyme A thioesterase PaaI-like protein
VPASTLDRLRAAVTDPTRLAPASRTAGARLVEVEPGRVVATLPSAEVLPPLGAALVLADFLLGAVVGTGLAPGLRVSTLSLHASVHAPGTGALTATARLGHLGTTGVSTAEVRGVDGSLVATLSSRCAVLPASAPPPVAESSPTALALRVTPGVAVGTADPGLANFGSTVQGGVLATVLAHALDAAAGGVELDVTFVRPVPTDGAEFTARATPVHAGSRFAVGRAELRDARDRLAAVGVASRWLGT